MIKSTNIWKRASALKRAASLSRLSIYDFYLMIRYSSAAKKVDDEYYLRRVLIVNSHLVEKGLSHKDFRPGFGKKQIAELKSAVSNYLKFKATENFDHYAFNRGLGALKSYIDMNLKHGLDVAYLLDNTLEAEFGNNYIVSVGSEKYVKKDEASYKTMNFEQIASERKSVRMFEHESLDISTDTLKKIANLSYTAPVGCNKQSIKVYFVKDLSAKALVTNLQGGSQGFGMNASAIAVVTVDLAEYRYTERRLPQFDAGLFCMNFAYSAKYFGCDTCMLNGSIERNNEKKILEIVGASKSEVLCLLIAIVKLDSGDTALVPISEKRPTEESVSFI